MLSRIQMLAQKCSLIAVLLVALVTGIAVCAVPSINALPASFSCSAEVLEIRDDDRDDMRHKSSQAVDQHLLRISFDSDEGSRRGLLYYYLRGIFRSRLDAGNNDSIDTKTSDYSGHGPADCFHEQFTSWLMPQGSLHVNQSSLRDVPPGTVTLCDGNVNGTLPINGSHTGSIESLKLSATDDVLKSSEDWRHRVSVYRTRSRLQRWWQLDRLHRNIENNERQVTLETVAWPTQRPLHRVRRQYTDYKDKPENRWQFQKMNVTFNLQTRFLTRNGPYVIKLHLYLDTGLKSELNNDNKSMLAAAKKVVNFANTLMRPFNAYIVVSSLHMPFGTLNSHFEFGHGDLTRQIKTEYISQNYFRMNDEVINCHFVFLGRERMNYSMSGSKEAICGTKLSPCRGFIILETKKPNYTRVSGFALAHEIGHSFGCSHDKPDSASCECRFPKCVMDEFVESFEKEDAPIGWSTCSIEKMVDRLDSKGGMACLMPEQVESETFVAAYSVDWGSTCGNGIVEPGEACDCGGVRACRANLCCQAGTCQLAKGAKCAVGICCDLTTCAARASGVVCRLAADWRCDFPEVCDGTSTVCPPDVTVARHWPCEPGGKNLCERGRCLAPPKTGANYTGPACTGDDVPISTGSCLAKPKPPAVALENYELALDKEDSDESAVGSGGGGGGGGGGGSGGGGGPGGPDDEGVGSLRASVAVALALPILVTFSGAVCRLAGLGRIW